MSFNLFKFFSKQNSDENDVKIPKQVKEKVKKPQKKTFEKNILNDLSFDTLRIILSFLESREDLCSVHQISKNCDLSKLSIENDFWKKRYECVKYFYSKQVCETFGIDDEGKMNDLLKKLKEEDNFKKKIILWVKCCRKEEAEIESKIKTLLQIRNCGVKFYINPGFKKEDIYRDNEKIKYKDHNYKHCCFGKSLKNFWISFTDFYVSSYGARVKRTKWGKSGKSSLMNRIEKIFKKEEVINCLTVSKETKLFHEFKNTFYTTLYKEFGVTVREKIREKVVVLRLIKQNKSFKMLPEATTGSDVFMRNDLNCVFFDASEMKNFKDFKEMFTGNSLYNLSYAIKTPILIIVSKVDTITQEQRVKLRWEIMNRMRRKEKVMMYMEVSSVTGKNANKELIRLLAFLALCGRFSMDDVFAFLES